MKPRGAHIFKNPVPWFHPTPDNMEPTRAIFSLLQQISTHSNIAGDELSPPALSMTGSLRVRWSVFNRKCMWVSLRYATEYIRVHDKEVMYIKSVQERKNRKKYIVALCHGVLAGSQQWCRENLFDKLVSSEEDESEKGERTDGEGRKSLNQLLCSHFAHASGDDAATVAYWFATGLLVGGNGDIGKGGEGVHDDSRGRLVRASRRRWCYECRLQGSLRALTRWVSWLYRSGESNYTT